MWPSESDVPSSATCELRYGRGLADVNTRTHARTHQSPNHFLYKMLYTDTHVWSGCHQGAGVTSDASPSAPLTKLRSAPTPAGVSPLSASHAALKVVLR